MAPSEAPVVSDELKRSVRRGTQSQVAQLDVALSLLEAIDKQTDELLRRTCPPPPDPDGGMHESDQ